MFKGESQCKAVQQNSKRCAKKALYVGQLCKVHVRKNPNAALLPKNPNKNANDIRRLKEHALTVERAADENRASGKLGHVVCSKLLKRRAPEEAPGFLKVFPNYWHGNRKDGYGCSSLSPMSMGPVLHGQPIDVAESKNLENLHQANKVFPTEVVPGTQDPSSEWYKTRTEMYKDVEPHRHKEQAQGNLPFYSIWVTPDGKELRLKYIESRQIYCHFYELFANVSPQFQHLQALRAKGTNLQIIGYDARPIPLAADATDEDIIDTFDKMYTDPSAPFGHELVICAMLMIKDPKRYPWRTHQSLDFRPMSLA